MKPIVLSLFWLVMAAKSWAAPGPVVAWGDNTYGQTNVPAGLQDVKGIAAGYFHALALRTNGTVIGWAGNFVGETTPPAGLSNVTAVAAGFRYSLALKSDGTVVAWGQSPFLATSLPAGLSNVVAISAGYDHGVALKVDGSVTAWGNGAKVPFGLTNATAVAAGKLYSLALKSDGTVAGWGSGPSSAVPAGLSNVVAVAAGDRHALALKADGTVVGWGDNTYGQATVPTGLTNVVAIAAGYSGSVAQIADGTVLAWGTPASNSVPTGLTNVTAVAAGSGYDLALLGNGPPTFPSGLANRLTFPGSDVYFYAQAIGTAPITYQWQLNGADIAGGTSPLLVLTNVQDAHAGVYTLLAANSGGSVTSSPAVLTVCDFGSALNTTNLTWTTYGNALWFIQTNVTHDGVSAAQSGGLNEDGNWPFPPSALRATVTGPGTLSFWWKVSSAPNGQYLSFVINGSTQTQVTGDVDWQQQSFFLGPGTQVLDWKYVPTTLPTGFSAGWLDQVTFVPGATSPAIIRQPFSQAQAPGGNATFTVAATGTPPFSYQWVLEGTNLPGATSSSFTVTNVQSSNVGTYSVIVSNVADAVLSSNAMLALGQVASWGNTVVPVDVTNALALGAGTYHSLAVRPDGTVAAWGDNSSGQINVPATASDVLAVAGGGWFSLALKSDGTVLAWGDNSSSQTNVPDGLSNVLAVAAGLHHALALEGDGQVVAWGDNTYGETNIPPGLTNAVAIAAGNGDSLALRADGTVVAWGNNSSGQTNVPAGLSNVVAIAAGIDFCLALSADGGPPVVWGNYSYGLTNDPSGLTNVVAISAGGYHNLALQANSTMASWGWNLSGATSVPTALTNVVTICAGGYHNLALTGNGPPTLVSPVGNPTWSGQGFGLTLPTTRGRVYQLQYKTFLSDANWTGLPLVCGDGHLRALTDPAPSDAQRFYRVRIW